MPGMICNVALCKNTFYKENPGEPKISFFRFPKNQSLQKIWVQRCYRDDEVNVKTGRICSAHFKEDDLIDDIQARIMGTRPKLKLKANALPSIILKAEEVEEIIETPIETPLPTNSSEMLMNLSNLPSNSKESDETIIKREYDRLQDENKILRMQLEKTKEELSDKKNILSEVTELLEKVFSRNEIQILLKKKTRACWTTDEISKAFIIRYFSKRCYLYLRNTLKYPLPGLSTLQKWASKKKLRCGLMEVSGMSKTESKRITMLSHDKKFLQRMNMTKRKMM